MQRAKHFLMKLRSTPITFRRLKAWYHSESSTVTAGHLTSAGVLETTNKLIIRNSLDNPKWPLFRILDPNGHVVEDSEAPQMNKASLVHQYRIMCRIQALDDIFYNAQRQGRISFYMQSTGEEATHVGMW